VPIEREFNRSKKSKQRSDTNLFTPDQVNGAFTDLDRLVVGGVMPIKPLELPNHKETGCAFFLERRELGAINVGGVGLAERPGENVVVPDGSPEFDTWQSSTAKGLVEQNQSEGWMTYWQPQDFNKGSTAVAIVVPKGSVQMFTNDLPNLPTSAVRVPTNTATEDQPAIRNLLAVTQAEIGKPFVYYWGAGWSESSDFPMPPRGTNTCAVLPNAAPHRYR
jgi:hypothetical protein